MYLNIVVDVAIVVGISDELVLIAHPFAIHYVLVLVVPLLFMKRSYKVNIVFVFIRIGDFLEESNSKARSLNMLGSFRQCISIIIFSNHKCL